MFADQYFQFEFFSHDKNKDRAFSVDDFERFLEHFTAESEADVRAVRKAEDMVCRCPR